MHKAYDTGPVYFFICGLDRTRLASSPETPVYPLSLLSRPASLLNSVPELAAWPPPLNAEDVDSRLTATLQAVLTTSRFLDRGDAAVIDEAARVALDSAAAAVAGLEEGGGGHAVEDSQGGGAATGMSRGWPGPNLAALSILTLLHVSGNRREGIPAALDVLQQMVSEWVNGFVESSPAI